MQIEYKHWEDYYKNEYLEIYNHEHQVYSELVNAGGGDVITLIESAQRIFEASCFLLDLFLRNNGLFQTNKKNILKHAFSINILPDGEEWIELGNLLYSNKPENIEYFLNFIIKNFYIFDKLNDQFKNGFNNISFIDKCEPISEKQSEIITYLKIKTLTWKCNSFRMLCEDFHKNQYEEEQYISPVFWEMRMVFLFYYKFLRFMLRQEGIEVLLPKDIIKMAQEKNIINDADIWYSYIEYMNVYFDKQDTNEQYKIMLDIVNSFKQAIFNVYSFINNDERKEILKEFKPIFDGYQREGIYLSENEPTYDFKDLGINEKSYNRIMDFFRSRKMLKNVWIHGSRARGTSMPGSDIDIIVDCPMNSYKSFCNALDNLNVPYMIDCKNINCRTHLKYIRNIQHLNTKKIYSDRQELESPQYELWENYYKNNFIPMYNHCRTVQDDFVCKNESDFDTYIEVFMNMYYISCKLMQVFLANNGIFVKKLRDVIKLFYYINYIEKDDGEAWIKYGDTVYSKESLSVDTITNVIKQNSYIFDKLNEKLGKLVVENA